MPFDNHKDDYASKLNTGLTYQLSTNLKTQILNFKIMATETPTQQETNDVPVHRIRHGNVSASIWRHETIVGPVFDVTFQRSYKDGETWKNSATFGRNQLLVLSLIAARAFEWIGAQPRKKPSTAQT